MTCSCGKPLAEKTIATKTGKAGEHTVVVTSRRALVCATHGVVAWDPPVGSSVTVPSQTRPWPWSPQPIYPQRPLVLPGSPHVGTALPYAGSPLPGQRPTNFCLS